MRSAQSGNGSSQAGGFSAGYTLGACVTALAIALSTSLTTTAAAERAAVLEIDGVIGPAIADYVTRELLAAGTSDIRLVVLRMNTPGGLDISMRKIIDAILASPVPVVTYVAPSGARAASAGTYIAYASPIAAMAPGTNIGAASPVRIGGAPFLPQGKPEPSGQKDDKEKSTEPADTEMRKITNDAVAYIRGLAELNGRNADWAVDAVRNAASIPASEALKLHVIDVIANDVGDLLRKIDGRTIAVAGRSETLATAGLEIATIAHDWRTELLAVVTNPNIAFILMLIGVYGLIFEFLNPGAIRDSRHGQLRVFRAAVHAKEC